MADPTNLIGETDAPDTAAVRGTHGGSGGPGVLGIGKANGVIGRSTGDGRGSAGVFGEAIDGPGLSGSSASSVGVDAKTKSGPAALRAIHAGNGQGVLGVSKGNGTGVHGICEGNGFAGVFGESERAPVFPGPARRRSGWMRRLKMGQPRSEPSTREMARASLGSPKATARECTGFARATASPAFSARAGPDRVFPDPARLRWASMPRQKVDRLQSAPFTRATAWPACSGATSVSHGTSSSKATST